MRDHVHVANRYKPRHNLLISSEFGSPNAFKQARPDKCFAAVQAVLCLLLDGASALGLLEPDPAHKVLNGSRGKLRALADCGIELS